ncbi:MAG: hypothetical protein NT037_07070 [Hyphomicrobiales bacterium]|jgi:hypothetical protein|nr:hypothetical protein [Hyphomicrobiales bacterium]
MTTALLGLRIGNSLHERVMVRLWFGKINRHNANSPVRRNLDGTRQLDAMSSTDCSGYV